MRVSKERAELLNKFLRRLNNMVRGDLKELRRAEETCQKVLDSRMEINYDDYN